MNRDYRDRISKAPYDLAEHLTRHGDYFAGGQILESARVMGTGKAARRRQVIYQYKFKRYSHDNRAINAMAKSDLRARPVFHHQRDATEAHLTVVFAALAIARELQAQTGASLKKPIQTLRPLRTATIDIDNHTITAKPQLNHDAEQILTKLPPVAG